MRKVKRPNLTVKPREVYYFLKRSRLLGGLTEEAIEEIISKENPLTLVEPACLYDHWPTEEWQWAGALFTGKNSSAGRTVTAGVATVGDRGLEAVLARLSAASDGAAGRQVIWGWAEALLGKLVDFTNSMIYEEASAESLELGLSRVIDAALDREALEVVWSRLQPDVKIGVRRLDEAEAIRFSPSITRIWALPWITKKEKKQLVAQS